MADHVVQCLFYGVGARLLEAACIAGCALFPGGPNTAGLASCSNP